MWGFGCEDWWELCDHQDSRCGGCDVEWRAGDRRLSIDHNHEDGNFERGLVRGLLCRACNDLLTEGVVRLIERRGRVEELVLTGGEVVPAGLVAYVLDPPGKPLGLVVPEELCVKLDERARRAAQTQAERGRGSGRARPSPTASSGGRRAGGKRRRPREIPRLEGDDHLSRALRGWCDCPECAGRRHRAERGHEPYRRRTEEEHARREALALARRVAEAAWDQEHAPQIWVRFGEGPRWAKEWQRRWLWRGWLRRYGCRWTRDRARREWVEERLARAGLVRAPSGPAGWVAMPDLPRVER